ncbi:AI-2E family transporter [Bartonella sp. TP]|uniref:AI-2E family transporter n=1 Tax=Bartonella sp. TP TaxID=3057550 RepID=UPI0025B0AD03|nr:AI-2E family transporter [Bartonella sp. TP]MDN5249529.1 AI-2E family transporter [Alphaproteobacteria bacterium]WJW79894.1 AI-2E family transporter [Bartonella sp. TP]
MDREIKPTKNLASYTAKKRLGSTIQGHAKQREANKNVALAQNNFWKLALVILLLLPLLFSSILFPFFIGLLIAYFLNPLIGWLSKIGISRLWGTVLITIFILLFLAVLLTFIVPVLVWQLQQFVTKGLPMYLEDIRDLLKTHNFYWIKKYFGSDPQHVENSIQTLFSSSSELTKSLMSSLVSSGKSIVGAFSLFIIAPVVAFYLLLDWDRMIANVDALIPRYYLTTIRTIMHDIDRAVAGFVRGQGTVCLLLAIYYIVGLSLCGLNYAILIGLYIGFASFIPYIGSFSGFLLSFVVAWAQYYQGEWFWMGVVVAVFFCGQFLEAYILQPKLVGNSVGLHPVWLMFALFAFGSLFGLTGMLIAVPCAAALGVLVRFAIARYVNSPIYKYPVR